MADLSKIKLNGIEYDIKDAEARQMVSDLEDSIDIPGALSDLDNDVGYITSYTEIDPTVPAWAKAAQKPTYTASEVGAVATTGDTMTGDLKIIKGKNLYFKNGTNTYTDDNKYDIKISHYGYLPSLETPILRLSPRYNNGHYVQVTGIANPSSNFDAANKQYVDESITNITYPVTSVNGATGAVVLSASDVGALSDSTTYVSSFNGNSGDITYTAPVTSVNGQTGAVTLTIPDADDHKWNDVSFDTSGEINGPAFLPAIISTSAKTAYLIKATNIPTQNKIAQYDSNAYLNSTTPPASDNSTKVATTAYVNAAIPSVPSWALESSKPTYTAGEVGALSSSTTYVSSVNGDSGAVVVDQLKTTASSNNTEYNLIGTAISNANIAAVDVYKQDAISFAKTTSLGRLTIGSTSLPGVVRIYTSADSASGFTDLKSAASGTTERTITFPDANGTVALTTDIPSVPSWALNSTKPSYTFSELTSHPTTLNDYGITNAYTKTEVDGLVSGVLHYKGTKSTTSALPTSGNVTGDVWHITADGSEWAWDGSAWQELGTATDLSGYLQTSDIAAWAKASTKPSYTANEVGALPSNTTYVSTFNGESGAITYIPPVTSVNGQTGAVTLTIPDADDHKWNNVELTKTVTTSTSDLYIPCLGSTSAISANLVKVLSGATTAYSLVQRNNNGYIVANTPSANDNSVKVATTAYVDRAIPSVPSWALASSKPTYTANEVGALPSSTTYVSSFNGQSGAITYTAPEQNVEIIELTYYNSIQENDETVWLYTTTQTISEIKTKIDNGKVIVLKNGPTFYYFDMYDRGYDLRFFGNIGDTCVVPYKMNNEYTYYWKSYTLNTGVEISNTLSSGTLIATIDDVDIYAPAYTAADIGAAASTHVHGNITSSGDITTNVAIASGDRLVINDESASKVNNSSITFGTSTTQYLANNGTWQNLPTISVSQTLTSGTEIGSVNNTKLYAPTPYDDSTLAARVTALEQLEWATYYSGRSNPSNSQGQNGDIYLQY